jgi:two-component system LytT family response regulator
VIRALIVDDEVLAREGIRVRLKDENDIEIVGEAADGPNAVRAIKKLTPDLVFLDVQVPGFDGFEILERVSGEYLPAVIFVTAYDKYAVKAFEAKALDYLLKPISRKRFQEAVGRVRSMLATEEALETAHKSLIELLQARVKGAQKGGPTDRSRAGALRLVVKDRHRFLLIKADEVDWVESAANYIDVHARGRSFLLRMTMHALEEKLDPVQFARIHRSTIVNVDKIREINTSCSHGDFDVLLDDGTTLRLSRAYRDRLLRDQA